MSDDIPIKNAESFTFDITTFMGFLLVNDPVTNSYDFKIEVQDKAGDKLEKKLVVRVTE